jgi:ketosteroid isomerase-like protein
MTRFLIAVLLLLSSLAPANALPNATGETDKKSVDAVLTSFHTAASRADWDTYFSLLSDNAIFLGTDASERWGKAFFKGYAAKTKGWTYTLRERHINFTPDGNTAWFDELLDQEKYGTSRGSGVLIRTSAGWKISQYNLTFPIPNDLADGITQQIQTFEAKQKLGQK